MKNILLVFIAINITSCCRDGSYYTLNQFEQTVIPFEMTQNLQYMNEKDITFSAVASEKTSSFEYFDEIESCEDSKREIQQSSLSISELNISFLVNLEKNSSGKTFFHIDTNDLQFLQTCEFLVV